MAVIFAVIGGGAVIGILSSDSGSDYGDYSEYSEYSDAAVRRERRMKEKREEIENQTYEINMYKTDSINEYLQSNTLKEQSGVSVSVTEVEKDGNDKLHADEGKSIDREGEDVKKAMEEIDNVISLIDSILLEDE